MRWLPAILWTLLLLCPAPASAGDDPLDEAKSLIELGQALIDAGVDLEDEKRIKDGIAKLREAKKMLLAEQAQAGRTAAEKNRIQRYVVDLDARLEWYGSDLFLEGVGGGGAADEDPDVEPEVRAPEIVKGEPLSRWAKRVRTLYDATESGTGRASLARQLAKTAGVIALPTLFELFECEEDADARDGVHEALARVGTSRVALKMGGYASRRHEDHWDVALDVIYRALERPESNEPERPWMGAIRRFHKLKDKKLTLRILTDLDAMGTPGIAALGEVVYVDDFGYHDYTITLLSKKRDTRAVPPLVYKMNRFKFDYAVQIPAHQALLDMGWYAVPELVNRLDDHAAGIWISWTLRKITGETMGTDKRKWGHWWLEERKRHPELFEDEDERPPVVTGQDAGK